MDKKKDPRDVSDTGKRSSHPKGKTAAISFRSVSKSFDGTPAVVGVNFDVNQGEAVILVGHNGSGKTTLLRILSGLAKADSGEVLIFGAKAGSKDARSVLSVAFDTPSLYDDLSTIEHLYFSAKLCGVQSPEEAARNLLDRFGLIAVKDRMPSGFSRGMRQKVALAMAFVRPFKAMIIDEPFVGLDQSGKNTLLELIGESLKEKKSFLVASHSLDLLEIADRCVALSSGEVCYDGSVSKAKLDELLG